MGTLKLLSRGGWAAGLVALAGTGLAAVPAASAAAAGYTCHKPVVAGGLARVVCPYTGAAAWWRVPAGVSSVTFDLYGAQGGAQADTARSVPGGLGAHLHSVQAVGSGQVLMIVVGGTPAPNSVAGGFNGGGSAGGRARPYSVAGGGGGGATDVRTGPAYTLAGRVLVAGGGGGNGGNAYSEYWSYNGIWAQGAPGGSSGRPGCCGINGGGAPLPYRGGAGGVGGLDTVYEHPPAHAPSGSPGALGVGGSAPGGTLWAGGGGGGGGGYYGGGGGGAAGRCRSTPEQCFAYAAGGFGGGGGSDYGGGGSPGNWVIDGAWAGNGLAVITYRAP
jgi:hypothetical protein